MKLSDILGVVGDKMSENLSDKGTFSGNINALFGKSATGIYNITGASGTSSQYAHTLLVLGSNSYNTTIQIEFSIPPTPPSIETANMLFRWGNGLNSWSSWRYIPKALRSYVLGGACEKGVATTVASGNTDLITSGAVYTALQNTGGAGVERGTWTPTFSASEGSNIGYSLAKYTRIDDIVICFLTGGLNIPTSGSTNILYKIKGLPFSPSEGLGIAQLFKTGDPSPTVGCVRRYDISAEFPSNFTGAANNFYGTIIYKIDTTA